MNSVLKLDRKGASLGVLSPNGLFRVLSLAEGCGNTDVVNQKPADAMNFEVFDEVRAK
jgi:hypothetical protein